MPLMESTIDALLFWKSITNFAEIFVKFDNWSNNFRFEKLEKLTKLERLYY